MAIFLQLKGKDIKGQVTNKQHKDWIEVDTFLLGASRQIDTPVGNTNNRDASRVHFDNLTLTKKVDSATAKLFAQMFTGDSLQQAIIHVCKTNDALQPYLEITLDNVLLSHFELSSNNEAENRNAANNVQINHSVPTETIRLDFSKIEFRHIPSGADNKNGSPYSTGYDLATATQL